MMIKSNVYKDFTTLRETRPVRTESKIMDGVMKAKELRNQPAQFF